jgi:UDP:flavonoid glycosyltransferase YjiC (YdhE family)
LDAQISDDLALVATLPALEIDRPDWPPYAHVIGPCLYDTGGETPPIPPGGGPLVLITASTAHEQRPLLEASLRAVEITGARAIVTTGKAAAPETVPSRVSLAPGFVSHDAILPKCDAVICNGGHGIVARALTHGVPLVVVPGHGDQQENGYRVARAGAGLSVKRRKMKTLPDVLSRVLRDGSFTAAAQKIEEEAATLDGPDKAAELIEDLATRRGTTTPAFDVP